MGNSNKYVTLLSNTVVFAIGNVLVKVISFFLMPLYTAVLTTEQYGVSELLNSAIEIILPIGTLCVIEALYRFSIEKNANYKAIFANSIRIVLYGDIVVLLVCVLLKHIFNYGYAFSFFFLYLATTFYKLVTQFSRGLGHVKRYALYGVINSLVLVLSNILLLVWMNGGVRAYLASFTIGYGVSGIVAFFASKEYRYISLTYKDKKLRNEMIRYSAPNIPNMLSWWINNISDRYIIMFFWGAGLTGLYTAASKLPAMINLFSAVFQQAWQYSTAKEIENIDRQVFFNKVFKIYSFGCLMACSALLFLNRVVCKILLKDNFYSAWKFVPILILAATLGCYSTFFGTFYNALKKNFVLMLSTLIGAGINIILNFVLIPVYGGIGAAVATVISYVIITTLRIVDVTKRIGPIADYKRLLVQFSLLFVITYITTATESIISYLLGVLCLFIIIALDYDTLKYSVKIMRQKFKR
ncbi:polysaccharide biosynthesis C-terminal domain-containing protein [Eubacterium sp.]|uniref:oligosaccharide flippase family protein n=1 Tax=Eubacterium sp. TaxID=142586 RepID=UPI0026DFBAAB|nr:polysaccharide biosynthesis C-terminal domain-containing protein [Eubacterium sp.]MDO5432580.1 polysaccharide biosynthesis C-terminal domain-containing protein [Eubacterium sp.]